MGNEKSSIVHSDKGTTEVISMSNTSKNCTALPPYPHKVSSASGLVVNSIPIISGGFGSNPIKIYSKIYKFDQKTRNWDLHGNLKSPRYQHSSVPLYDGIFVMGGRDDKGKTLKSTEIVSLNGMVTKGIDLPSPRSAHCSVILPNEDKSSESNKNE